VRAGRVKEGGQGRKEDKENERGGRGKGREKKAFPLL